MHEDQTSTGLIRTILDVNHEEESLIFAGDIQEGCLVCLMHSDTDDLVDGAQKAAENAGVNLSQQSGGIALLVSCVGRKLIMGDDVDEEVEAVKDIFGQNTNIAGFYSYGEICTFLTSCSTELHNQTMTVTYITE